MEQNTITPLSAMSNGQSSLWRKLAVEQAVLAKAAGYSGDIIALASRFHDFIMKGNSLSNRGWALQQAVMAWKAFEGSDLVADAEAVYAFAIGQDGGDGTCTG